MVWGMSERSSFGEFWPSGKFEGDRGRPGGGWWERLIAYYKDQMPEEQRAVFDDASRNGPGNYAYFVFEKFIRELGTATNPEKPPISPIEPHEPPRWFETRKPYSALGSLIELNNRMLAVDEPLKEIIERFEPAVHQFFPIEIRMPRGKTFPRGFYTLVIGRYLDSFSPQDSREGSWRADGQTHYFYEQTKRGITGLAFKKSIFNGAHLWRERRFSNFLTCFSDELQAAIAESGLRTPPMYKMKEI